MNFSLNIYQYRFINGDKCTTLIGYLLIGETECGGIWKFSVLFFYFYKPKTIQNL